MKSVKIGTRTSNLAIYQANKVKNILKGNGINSEIIGIKSDGDRSLAGNLSKSVGQFVYSIDDGLISHKIDLAVHSSKDVPVNYNSKIQNLATLERGVTSDLILFRDNLSNTRLSQLLKNSDETDPEKALKILNKKSLVGTVSGRRQALMLSIRPDIIPISVRGSVETRITKLINGNVDAIIIAEVGIRRLNESNKLDENMLELCALRLQSKKWPTAPGQGAITVHCLMDNSLLDKGRIRTLLNHDATEKSVNAEKKILEKMGGGCLYPAGIESNGEDVNILAAPENWRRITISETNVNLLKYSGSIKDFKFDTDSFNIKMEDVPYIGHSPKIISTLNSDRLSRILVKSDINMINRPVIDLEVVKDNWPTNFLSSIKKRSEWPWLILTSPFAARCAVSIIENNIDIGRIPWLAIGEGTAAACFELGHTVSDCAKVKDSEDLLLYIRDNYPKSTKFLIPQSNLSGDKFVNGLLEQKYKLNHWLAYNNSSIKIDGVEIGDNDVILMSSPSSVRSWVENNLPVTKNILCMGRSSYLEITENEYFKESSVDIIETTSSEFIINWWKDKRGD